MSDCLNSECTNKSHDGYELCTTCIKKFVRICTCNKQFISEKPSLYVLGTITTEKLPDPIPEFFYTQIIGNLYHILGCRGHQYTEISVRDEFNKALQASIVSCIYQKEGDEYEYLSDSLDPDFEEYANNRGIKIGDVVGIPLGSYPRP